MLDQRIIFGRCAGAGKYLSGRQNGRPAQAFFVSEGGAVVHALEFFIERLQFPEFRFAALLGNGNGVPECLVLGLAQHVAAESVGFGEQLAQCLDGHGGLL
jgi:hypothetical protein